MTSCCLSTRTQHWRRQPAWHFSTLDRTPSSVLALRSSCISPVKVLCKVTVLAVGFLMWCGFFIAVIKCFLLVCLFISSFRRFLMCIYYSEVIMYCLALFWAFRVVSGFLLLFFLVFFVLMCCSCSVFSVSVLHSLHNKLILCPDTLSVFMRFKLMSAVLQLQVTTGKYREDCEGTVLTAVKL